MKEKELQQKLYLSGRLFHINEIRRLAEEASSIFARRDDVALFFFIPVSGELVDLYLPETPMLDENGEKFSLTEEDLALIQNMGCEMHSPCYFKTRGVTSVTIPLEWGGECAAILVFSSRGENKILLLAKFLARVLAVAGSRESGESSYNLKKELRAALRKSGALLEINRMMAYSPDLSEILQRVVEVAAEILQAEKASILLLDEESAELTLSHGTGFEPELYGNVRIKVGEGVSGTVAVTGEPLLIKDPQNNDSGPESDLSVCPKEKTLISVPMKVMEKVVGVLNCYNKLSGRMFDEEDTTFLMALAAQAAAVVENTGLRYRIEKSQAELDEQVMAYSDLMEEVAALYDIIRAIGGPSEDGKDPAERILESAVRTMSAELGMVGLIRGEEVIFEIVKGSAADSILFRKTPCSKGFIGEVLAGRASVLVNDYNEQEKLIIDLSKNSMVEKPVIDPFLGEFNYIRGFRIRSFICVPLYAREEPLGIMILFNRTTGERVFTEANRNLAEVLGEQIAAVILNRRLLEESIAKKALEKELDVARSIQEKLLPKKMPDVEGVDIAALNIPARAVGGDYYDVLVDPDCPERIGLVIADVSGKGVPAAMIMAMTRAILRTQSSSRINPSEILESTNNFLVDDIENNRFVTMFLGVLDTKTRVFRYSKAGHNPPILFRKSSQKVEFLEAQGLFLGMFPGAKYETREVVLEPGDKMVFFTDGITEAMNEKNEEFTQERLINIIRECSHYDSRSLIDRIVSEIQTFSGNAPQFDDLTILVVGTEKPVYNNFELPSQREAIVEISEKFMQMFSESSLTFVESFELIMILDELLANAMEHGNKFNPEKKVYCSYIFNSYKFELVVRDLGEGFNWKECLTRNGIQDVYNGRGRGISIVARLADRIEYNERGNEVRVVKYLRKSGSESCR